MRRRRASIASCHRERQTRSRSRRRRKALDTRSRNRLQKSVPLVYIRRQIPAPVFRADARLLTSLTAFGPRRQSMTLEVAHRHENWRRNLASNLWRRFLEPVSGACVSGLTAVVGLQRNVTVKQMSALWPVTVMTPGFCTVGTVDIQSFKCLGQSRTFAEACSLSLLVLLQTYNSR